MESSKKEKISNDVCKVARSNNRTSFAFEASKIDRISRYICIFIYMDGFML